MSLPKIYFQTRQHWLTQGKLRWSKVFPSPKYRTYSKKPRGAYEIFGLVGKRLISGRRERGLFKTSCLRATHYCIRFLCFSIFCSKGLTMAQEERSKNTWKISDKRCIVAVRMQQFSLRASSQSGGDWSGRTFLSLFSPIINPSPPPRGDLFGRNFCSYVRPYSRKVFFRVNKVNCQDARRSNRFQWYFKENAAPPLHCFC